MFFLSSPLYLLRTVKLNLYEKTYFSFDGSHPATFCIEMGAEEIEVKEIPLEKKVDKRLERTGFVMSIESCYNTGSKGAF